MRVRGPANIDDITDAEMLLIKHAQHNAFKDEIGALRGKKPLPNKSKLLPLRMIVDNEDLLRCDSQLKYSSCLPWATKYPVILPRNSQVKKSFIKDCHERSGHAGTNYVFA